MRKLLLLLIVLFSVSTAHAQTVENDLVGLGMPAEQASYLASILPAGSVVGNNTFIKGRNQANSADINILKVDATDDTVLNADSGDTVKVSVANTPVANFPPIDANGFTADLTFVAGTTIRNVPYVPTMAATPVAGTNAFSIGVNAIPTAAANTAALMPTPIAAGQKLIAINTGPNAVRLKPGGTNTINGGSAGAYIPLATLLIAECESLSTSAWQCGTKTIPTPAGP